MGRREDDPRRLSAEIAPLFGQARTTQRTVYRPGEVCQFDVWEPRAEIPVGHGQTRQGCVVLRALATRAPAPARWLSSKRTPDLLAGIRRCLWQLGGLPQTLVWDRQAGIHAFDGLPTRKFAALCGQLKVDWHFCRPRDPQAKGRLAQS